MSNQCTALFDPGGRSYEPICKLGGGAFGEVWKIRNALNGIEKALKVIFHPSDSEMAKREIRAIELLKNRRHPFLLAVEDYWVHAGRLHIVMELADESLRDLLLRYQGVGVRGIPRQELLALLFEVAEGIDFLHALNVVHRDIKPDNLLTLGGHAKVADCGVARAHHLLGQGMSVVGTPRYMGPEVWVSEGGPASDCYSLAITYVELLQGFHPLAKGSLPEVIRAHEQGLFQFDNIIGEEERRVLWRALAKQPGKRYGSCTEFVTALAAAS